MAYKAYVTPKYYLETDRGTSIPKSELDLRLRDASRHIDSLTYSRIVGQGFSALTEFQQDVIREVVCRQADFEAENREALDCALSSYSINGVSMTLTAGLNCVRYKNGARHTLADYADMAIRTACKRAKLQGEGQMRQKWGVSTVIMNKRGNPCPKCLPWVGKILIDDVWSGGSRKDGPYPLMSTAIAAGLYHPRCKDGHTTYFEGISTPPDNQFTRKELKQIEKDNWKEAQKQYAERQREKFGRLADYSLDPENKERYAARKNAWEQEKAIENRDGNAIMTYKGIPKTWKRLEGTADDLDLKKVNPNYRWSSNDEYSRNCYNCVVAYEMRMRKYDVTVQPERKNKYLSRHPEAAWVEPDVKTIHTGEDPYQKIKDAFEEWPDGARAEVAIIWKGIKDGHVFMAKEENGQIKFLDPQRNKEYTADIFKGTEDGKTSFWRIDDRTISDRGITACKEV